MSETELDSACQQYLTLKGIFYWRNNTGALVSEYKGKKRFIRYGATGSPDIFALKDGKLIGIECKFGKNKQSEGQIEFQRQMEKNGAKYLLIYDIEQLLIKL